MAKNWAEWIRSGDWADPIFAEIGIDEIRLAALDAEAPALYNTTKHILRM